jgi:CTP:phosphocholine cytidylyltransferase-like protein/thiamine kinase-like enzyme
MNFQGSDILSILLREPYMGQRELSAASGHSLGVVNRSLKQLIAAGFLTANCVPTEKARDLKMMCTPKNAVILAAGFGMRMVPINMELPKALLEVHGEVLIERTIRQLKEAGVEVICVVVGFMKEHFEYLIDEYGVELVVNTDYATKNNLHSLSKVLHKLGNTYIVPCDIWCRENPYSNQEFYSWYMVTDRLTEESTVRVNRQRKLINVSQEAEGNSMVGICYLTAEDAEAVQKNAQQLSCDRSNDDAFWESALFGANGVAVQGRVVDADSTVEINTYEQLRELDSKSNNLDSEAIGIICQALQASSKEITDITVLKKGMTNRSFLFRCKGKKYIMRIPGEGTDQLINRTQEANVYLAIDGKGICDDIAYINPENGYKITEFLEGARVCDPMDRTDVEKCMVRLRKFHEMKLQVGHSFDIFGQITFYENLWAGAPSCFRDYQKTKERVFSLRDFIDRQKKDQCLTHIDAVPDNFLFVGEDLRLIDWEYAGMQDPHVDIAMFCIYAMYDACHVEELIDDYFPEGCSYDVRTKIYCYIAACGLLWSNWCEYKRQLGVEFGEYSLRQYRFAKEYYKIAVERITQGG